MKIELCHPRSKEKNPNWKGGIRRRKNGYVYILMPNHPDCHKDGYIPEHRLVMEKKLKRRLLPSEEVHHKNEIKYDNRPSNLILTTKSKHSSEHKTGELNPRFRHEINDKELIALRNQGKSYKEISNITGFPETTVRRRILK